MERDIKSLKADLSSYIKTELDFFDPILSYIDQYYGTHEKILKFLKNNPDFDIGHILGLVNVAPEVQKLKKNEIKSVISSVEDIYVEYLSRIN